MVDRNDPCPCRSGKKYKKCCQDKPKVRQIYQVPPFAMSPLVKDDVFKLLFEGSELFQRYYKEVRNQLPEFQVVHDPNQMEKGIRAGITRDGVKKYLRVRTMVCPLDSASLIAHELGHLLLDTEGFPNCPGLNNHPAAGSLNSAFSDPIIDHRLVSFGFDRDTDREAEMLKNKQLLEKERRPKDAAGKALWTANCLGYLLNRHILGEFFAEEEFIQWFRNLHPSILKTAERVYDEVIKTGFDTPEKMHTALGRARTMLKNGGGIILPPKFESSIG